MKAIKPSVFYDIKVSIREEGMMQNENTGLWLGGVMAAIFFGINGVTAKMAFERGISTSWFLVFVGFAVLTAGFLTLFFTDSKFTVSGATWSYVDGFVWAIGTALVGVSLEYYKIPISRLSALYSTSPLITVALALIFLHESTEVNHITVMTGAILIVAGGIIVTR